MKIIKNIKLYSFSINTYAFVSFQKCCELYESYGGLMYTIKDFNDNKDEIISNFKNLIVDVITCAAPIDE